MMLVLKLLILLCTSLTSGTNYYELLGVPKTANNNEIRRAFKKLAVTLHPDKNQDDPGAHDRFIQLTRAYEVLKDDEKRKYYDIHGEDSKSSAKPQYQSYTYYRDYFGIYDDDYPQIITLSQSDFESNVEGSEMQWFVNFYSPLCSHCHDLAPTWRSLARELQGVVMFAAVNCEDDWALCSQHGIHSYPSLILYPLNQKFKGDRTKFELREFILDRVETDLMKVRKQEIWEKEKNKQENWLILLNDNFSIPPDTSKAIASMLKGLTGVVEFDCTSMPCKTFQEDKKTSAVYLERNSEGSWTSIPVDADLPQDMLKVVLDLLPNVKQLDFDAYKALTSELQKGSPVPWLIYFYIGPTNEVDLEVKKLTALLPNFQIGGINCGRLNKVCSELSISRYPMFGVFKSGGGREFHHGANLASSIASFARESAPATNLRSLTGDEFQSTVKARRGAWFVDFYAPWCPPCLKLLHQLRKASGSFPPEMVSFATIDCTIEESLCKSHNIHHYPTTLLFNSTKQPQQFKGAYSANSIVEFVQDLINPLVIPLDKAKFYSSVGKKSADAIWMVEFFMPWCEPCQLLAPQYRKLAKMVADLPAVYIAEVNCQVEGELCSEQGVKSYPHIRLYPRNSLGLDTVALYSGYQRDAYSLRRWLYSFLSSPIVELSPGNFNTVTDSDRPWLVDFYAPWCGHCIAFEPEFISMAQKLKGKKVRTGKVNCEHHQRLCQSAGVTGYPTVMFYPPHSGKMRGIEIQSQSQTTILAYIEHLLKPGRSSHDEL